MKRLLAAMTAALLMVALLSSTTFAGSAKWTLGYYNGAVDPNLYTTVAANPHGGSIATFAFDQYPNQALLTSVANGYVKNGGLLGKTVTATVSITGPAGTAFTAYTDTALGGTCAPGTATVRFYFDTNLQLGAPDFGVYDDQLWWSNPVSISLADLFAAGPNGVTLSVSFAPANWSNLVGTFGNLLVAPYAADFSTAASNVNQVGFSFGSPSCYAFGDGSPPAGAMFNLMKFSTH